MCCVRKLISCVQIGKEALLDDDNVKISVMPLYDVNDKKIETTKIEANTESINYERYTP